MAEATPQAERPAGARSFLEFVVFLFLGGLAALANLVARYLLNFIMPFEAAVVVAYVVGMVVAFILFGRLVFEGGKNSLQRRIIRFTQVNVLGGVLAWAVSVTMARFFLPAVGWVWQPLEVAHFVGVATPAVSSYFLHKHYTFS